jgi:23S rRNA (guanosine2251-2'-O)-methyltransferase
VQEALHADVRIEKIFICFGADDPDVHRLRSLAAKSGIAVSTMDKRKFATLVRELGVHGNAAQSVIALREPHTLVTYRELVQGAMHSRPDPILVVLDGITDPHNLGAIARSAECAGAYGLILSEHHSAPITPAAVKTSAGALEVLPVCKVQRVSTTLRELRNEGWKVVGTAVPAQQYFNGSDLSGPVVIVIASLNASVASGIILFEAARQRRSNAT